VSILRLVPFDAPASFLDVKPYYGTDANAIATRAAHTASLTMDQPVDIVPDILEIGDAG
jgi:hypothetical protein